MALLPLLLPLLLVLLGGPARTRACALSAPYSASVLTCPLLVDPSGSGKGILASDESNATTNKRLEAVGIVATEDQRRDWRQLLYTAPGLGQYISGESRASV